MSKDKGNKNHKKVSMDKKSSNEKSLSPYKMAQKQEGNKEHTLDAFAVKPDKNSKQKQTKN